MPTDFQPATASPLDSGQKVARLAIVAAIVGVVVATFAFLGGWFSPNKLTPKKLVDVFQGVDGEHPGFRRNHAKGLCVSGHFDSTGNGSALSKAEVFQPGNSDVVGRFSLGGGMPFQPDNANTVRGLGLQLTASNGQVWRTAMINLPVFPVNTPQAFYDLQLAHVPDPATGKPDPAKFKDFVASHAEFLPAIKIITAKPPAATFAETTYHGLNAFIFTDFDGKTSPVRWVFTPVPSKTPVAPKLPAPPMKKNDDPNYLFDGLITAVHAHPLQWHLVLIVGQPGDPTDDATLPWPATRKIVDAGTLTIDKVESDDTSPTAKLNFDPLVLPNGISPSDDPLLSARSAAYSNSYTRRTGEQKPPSALTPAAVDSTK